LKEIGIEGNRGRAIAGDRERGKLFVNSLQLAVEEV
jgi:hypothetical protein